MNTLIACVASACVRAFVYVDYTNCGVFVGSLICVVLIRSELAHANLCDFVAFTHAHIDQNDDE